MRRFFVYRTILFCWSVLVMSCGKESGADGGSESHYIRYNEANTGVIVFVHGVTGNGIDTWTNASTGAYWPEMLTRDSTFAGYNIYAYDYNSPLLERSYSIEEISENMRLIFDADKVGAHQKIVFVSHSMGGLVTRSYLLKYREIARRTKMIYFLSTPTTGSEISKLATIVSKNPQFGNMVSMESGNYLANQQLEWQAAGFDIPCFCGFEVQATYGQRVVEQQSSTNLCNQRLDPINLNHIDIAKPNNSRHVSYLAFKSAFLEKMTDKELSHYTKYLKVGTFVANCPMFAVPPAGKDLAPNSTESYAALFADDYITWPQVADIYQPYFSMLRIESTRKDGAWIRLENKLRVSFEVDTSGIPEKSDVVVVGECGGIGDPKLSDKSIVLIKNDAGKVSTISYKAGSFYTLQPGEFEEFEFCFKCGSPGTYKMTYEIPYSISGKSGIAVFKDERTVKCLKSFSLFDTGHLVEYSERPVIQYVADYKWKGAGYSGPVRKALSDHVSY